MTQIADFDHNIFAAPDEEADKALAVRFYNKTVQDKAKSDKEGRPVFREKEYIEIRFPGNRTDAVARPATLDDKNRFYRHYDAFKRREEAPEEGTPLSEWPMISRTQVEELAYFNVKTVEQLAAVADHQAQKFMGFNTLRDKARKFLEQSKRGVEAVQLERELASRDEQIAAMQAQLDKLTGSAVVAEEPKTESSVEQGGDAVSQAESPAPRPRSRRRKKTEE